MNRRGNAWHIVGIILLALIIIGAGAAWLVTYNSLGTFEVSGALAGSTFQTQCMQEFQYVTTKYPAANCLPNACAIQAVPGSNNQSTFIDYSCGRFWAPTVATPYITPAGLSLPGYARVVPQ